MVWSFLLYTSYFPLFFLFLNFFLPPLSCLPPSFLFHLSFLPFSPFFTLFFLPSYLLTLLPTFLPPYFFLFYLPSYFLPFFSSLLYSDHSSNQKIFIVLSSMLGIILGLENNIVANNTRVSHSNGELRLIRYEDRITKQYMVGQERVSPSVIKCHQDGHVS